MLTIAFYRFPAQKASYRVVLDDDSGALLNDQRLLLFFHLPKTSVSQLLDDLAIESKHAPLSLQWGQGLVQLQARLCVLEGLFSDVVSVRRPPSLEGHRPILVTVDVFGSDSSYQSSLLMLPPQLDEVVDALVDEVAVVLEGGIALHFWRYRVEAFLQEFLEVLLLQSQHVLALGPLLEIAFDNRPESLNRVQLWSVGRHEHELKVQLPRHLLVDVRLVCRMII